MQRSTRVLVLTVLAWATASLAASAQPGVQFPEQVAPAPAVAPPLPHTLDQLRQEARQITPAKEDAARRPLSPQRKAAGHFASPWATVVALAIVLAGVILAARLWRRHAPAGAQSIPGEALEILGRRVLDRRQSLLLVRCGSRILLLGSSDAGLRSLAEIGDPTEVDYLAGACRRRDAESSFSQSLSTFFQRSRPAATPAKRRPDRHAATRAEPAWKQAHA